MYVMVNPLWTFDRKRIKDHSGIIGVDEAGRGCLAGPVIAGAVLLPRSFFQKPSNRMACAEINDSKQIKESQREELFDKIAGLEKKGELFWAVGDASVKEIESENIVGATCLAMKKAMDKITSLSRGAWKPTLRSEGDLFFKEIDGDQNSWIVSVDGRPMKRIPYLHEGMIKGDTYSLAIAMGSIMAKVTRDRLMRGLAKQFRGYDFSSNKGYGSPRHLTGLKERGPCIHHRLRFLRKLLSTEAEKKTIKENSQSQLSFF